MPGADRRAAAAEGMYPVLVANEVSLATVARALDAMLDGVMTAQARVLAHLVAAAEASGQRAGDVIATLDAVAAATVLDECWVSDANGEVCVTNVRDETGAPKAFRFDPDPAVQPQASAFFRLLSSSVESDDVVAQGARVREIDNEVFKYVGVSGVDRPRIVQVGNALAFEEQAAVADTYVSPVMTAVIAAFDEPDLLEFSNTSAYDEIRPVFDGILGQHLIVQATLAERFLRSADAAGWPPDDIDGHLRRIVRSTPIAEIHVAARSGEALYSSDPQGRRLSELAYAEALGRVAEETRPVDHPTPTEADGPILKHVTVPGVDGLRVIQLGYPIDDGLPVSPRFGSATA